MTRMTGPDCAVMCNLINTHTHTHTHTQTYTLSHTHWQYNKYTYSLTHTHSSGNGNRNGNGDGNGDGDGDGSGNGSGIGDGEENENGKGRGQKGGGELWYLPHRERSRVKDHALPSRTRHYICRQEAAPAGSQQLRVQDLAPVRRCGAEGRTGYQGRDGGSYDGNRDENGNEHKARDAGENWSGNGDEYIDT